MRKHRKRIWIDPFQTGLLIRIGLYCLVYQVATWAFFSLCDHVNDAFTELGADRSVLGSVFVRSVLALLILVPPLTLDAVRFAHRLVGPLYRIRKTMQAVAAGEPVTLVELRPRDMLVDFKNDFNAMLEHMEQQGYVLMKAAKPPVKVETLHKVGGMAAAMDHPGVQRP